MKRLTYPLIAIFSAAMFVFTNCGPSKADREAAARADSIRKADSIAQWEAMANKIKQDLLDSIRKDGSTKPKSEQISVQPLTQYLFVSPGKEGPKMRDEKALKSLLTNLGFSVKIFKEPSNMEFGEPFTFLKASRKGNGGITTVKGITNIHGFESSISKIQIDFANQEELNKFIESMVVSNYSKHGKSYHNPKNYREHVEVDINGKSALITFTFEC